MTTMWAPMLVIGIGAGIGVLAAAVNAPWLLVIALLVLVAGGFLFFSNMQKT